MNVGSYRHDGYLTECTDSKGRNLSLSLNPTHLLEPGLCERNPTNRSLQSMDRIHQIHALVHPPAHMLHG